MNTQITSSLALLASRNDEKAFLSLEGEDRGEGEI